MWSPRHKGLAVAISSIRRRISTAVAGLPRRRRLLLDKRAQNLRNRSRCHRTTVSAWTYIRGERQRFHSKESPPRTVGRGESERVVSVVAGRPRVEGERAHSPPPRPHDR